MHQQKDKVMNIPNLDPLFEEVLDFVKTNQGEKGYIDCQPSLNNDIIYGIVFDDFMGSGLEKYVYGVRVDETDGVADVEILLKDITHAYRTLYTDEDFKASDEWVSLKWSDVYFVPTLFNIAESIEEYIN